MIQPQCCSHKALFDVYFYTSGGQLWEVFMGIGKKVREQRVELGFSQERLARQAGITLSAVQRLEAGIVTDPHYSTLASLARALGTTVAELVGEEVAGEAVSLAQASQAGSQELADVADGLLVLGHHLLETWESELPDRAQAGDDEWLGNISATWTLFSQINYKVLKAVGPHGLNNLEGWFAKYMDVNATIRRLNEAISEHTEEDAVKLERLVGA
jgi:transcriptional regulator with XRE-family HTH domain